MSQETPDLILNGLAAAVAGVLGRVIIMTEERRSPFSWNLLWELPSGWGLGIVGWATGEYFHLQGLALISCAIVLSMIGPRTLSWVVQRAVMGRIGVKVKNGE